MSETNAPKVQNAKPKATKSKVASKAKAKNLTYFNMVSAAIENLKEPRGASRQAILKFIIAKYKLDEKQAVAGCRAAIKKSLEDGRLSHGRTDGRFKLGDAKKAKKTVKKAANKKTPIAKAPSTKKTVQKSSPKKSKAQAKSPLKKAIEAKKTSPTKATQKSPAKARKSPFKRT